MAIDRRSFPNTYFAWYNDDDRLAIVTLDNESTSSEGTREKYDTYQDSDVTNGIRLTFHSKYEETTATTDDLKTTCGLDSALHNALVCYVKSRLYEDSQQFQQAQYFKQMYDNKVKTHRSRKSGVRALSVPKL